MRRNNTQGLHKLLFEISNNERMAIMLELQRHQLKSTQISKKLNLTVTETSRHLQRLSEDSLIHKKTNGTYTLTRFGTLALSLLTGFNFVSEHKDYFLEYDTSGIPYEFIERIGELEKSTYVAETLKNLEEGEKKIKEAQKLTWILTDQVLTSTIAPLAEKSKTPSFDLRIILPEGAFPPDDKSSLPSRRTNIQKRTMPKIDILIVLTEKYAILCLPNRTGRIDYTGFTGEDPTFHKWCQDLYLHFWNQAKGIGLSPLNQTKNNK